MSYNKQNFKPGQVLKAQYLNNIENGIVNLEQSLGEYATEKYVDNSIENINIPSLDGYATEEYVIDIINNIQGGDGNINIDLELRLKDDLNDTEDPSVKLARATINSVLNKPTTKEYIITYKYLCDGVPIKDEVVEAVAEGTIKIFNISNALVIDGYEISSVNPTNATVNNNIVVTYEYIKICVHNYTETITKQPTCTEKGIKTCTCSLCNYTYTEDMPMLEHEYVETITKEATCKQTGIKTCTCSLCNHTYTEDIPKESHEYVDGVCIKCGDHVHNYIETITKQPTCTEKGIKTYACSLCEDLYTEEISMLEHEYVSGICANCGNSEFPIHPTYNELDLTSLFNFAQYPSKLMGTGGSSITNIKTSSYFDSAIIDVSQYAGQKLRIKIPAYTSSSGGSSFARTCLVSSATGTPQHIQDLYVWDLSPTGESASGQLVEHIIELPDNAQYLWTSKFNQTALNNGIGTDDFYCTLYKDVVCTNISLNETTLSFDNYSKQTLIASVLPENTTQKIIWSSSDEKVAVVENGVITPMGNGDCIITVTCGKQTATCSISVDIKISEVDITDMFNFSRTGYVMNTNNGSSPKGIFQTSSFFDTAIVDISAYAGQRMLITIPAYTASNGGLSYNCTCIVSDNTSPNGKITEILKVWDLSPTGVAKSGQMIEYTIAIPNDAQYLLTSKFNANAISQGIGDDNFYCKVYISRTPCTNITLNETSLKFTENTMQTLVASILPSDTTDRIIWSSDNDTIASVNNGVVIPRNNGNCIITATCGDCIATCNVEVSIDKIEDDTGQTLDITNMFDFTIHPKMVMNTSTVSGNTGTWKSSSYFDSAVVDLSAYAGKTIKITIPAYNSSTGVNACNISCLVNDTYSAGSKPLLKQILHRWEVYSEDTSFKAIGEYREYEIELPSDTKYFLTTIYNPDALDKCTGSTEFYCKVIL